MSDSWPSPDAKAGPLPRIEELPIADSGYEQEAVRAAFESFYRHAAQLDATLRALEAVEVFRRDADALRNDLRAIRAFGSFAEAEPAWATQTYERARPEVPAVVLRLAAEAALIIAVAVAAGAAHLASLWIVVVMAAAFAVVATSEWLAARARFISPVSGFVSAELLEPAPYVEIPAPAAEAQWGGVPDEETEPESLTVVGEPALDPWEADEAVEPEDEEAAAPGFFRRRRR
jgi:hypothetical protein